MSGMPSGKRNDSAAAIPWGVIERPEHARAADRENFVARIGCELAAAWRACGAFEWVAFGYLAASSVLIAAFHSNPAHRAALLSVETLVAVLILMLCGSCAKAKLRAEELRPAGASKNLHFWRHWYPHLFFLFCFEEMGQFVHLIYPGWYDAKLIAFDHWLTGVNPPLWLERFAHPALNEFMEFAYFTYFLYLLILGGIGELHEQIGRAHV